MDKWKIVVIVLLLAGLAGYGVSQNSASTHSAAAAPTPGPKPTPLPHVNWEGKPIPTWSVAPDYWMNTTQPITPKDTLGSVTLLEFFRINCPHCQEAAPFMTALYEKYKVRGLKMIAFQSRGPANPTNEENNWQSVQDKVHDWSVTYPVAFDKDSKLFRLNFGGRLYPTVFLVDRKGIIRYHEEGFDAAKSAALLKWIEKMLKQ